MRKTTLVALALASTTLIATPAMATADHAGYAGIEAGVWFPNDLDIEFDFDDSSSYDLDVDMKTGFDGDICK